MSGNFNQFNDNNWIARLIHLIDIFEQFYKLNFQM